MRSRIAFFAACLSIAATPAGAADPRADPSALYQLSTQWQGVCKSLDIVNDGRNNNVPTLSRTDAVSGQSWKLTPARDGYFHLSTEWRGMSQRLDIVNDGRNDTPVLAAAGDFSGQYWRIDAATAPGFFTLSTQWQGAGKRLDVLNDGAADKPRLAVAGNFSGQLWRFTRVERVSAPPASLGLHPFYKKYLDAEGIPVVSSQAVPDAALYRARYLILEMLAGQDGVREEMVRHGARVAIMGAREFTTRIPEHAYLKADMETQWNLRARGLGGTVDLPLTTGAEENVLCQSSDRYAGEDIFMHEFAHAIHHLGLHFAFPDFETKLSAAYANAQSSRLWAGTYAMENEIEYFAEGVQSWFDVNQQPNSEHGDVDTRAELQAHDLQLYTLIAEHFPADLTACSCQ